MKFAAHSGEISYEVSGKGPALLLLHAFPLGLAMWDAQAAGLAERCRVIRFDARGFGGSPSGAGPLTMERIADDAAALLDHLGIDKAVVAGLSMGGYAAFAMTRRHAERLSGLILANTRSGPDSEEAKKGRAELAARVRREGPRVAAEAMLPRLVGETTKRERPEVAERLGEIILGNAAEGIAQALEGMALRADSTKGLGAIKTPTLVIAGEEDVVTPMAEAEAMARGISGSRLVVIPRAGHLSNIENPQAFNEAVMSFLQSMP